MQKGVSHKNMACVFFCLERKWSRMTQVFRVERNKNFTVMSNHHFKNKDLSLKAKGLLSLMLSLPEDWNYNIQTYLLNTIFSCITSIFISFLYFGQYSGNFTRTVSSYTFVLVFPPQIGQWIQREFFRLSFTLYTSNNGIALRWSSGFCLFISISQKSQWTTISHSSSALWLCVRLFDNYFFLLFFHVLYITLETGSKTHIATNQSGKCGIISILLILYKIEYSRCNADSSNNEWYNNS